MPILSDMAREAKKKFFLASLPLDVKILEIGCGTGWVGEYLRGRGFTAYVGVDINPPADIVGDIRKWRELGLEPESFDVIVAFEVVEHVHCFQECFDLLKPGGCLMLTSPVPCMDWMCKIIEVCNLTQRRTSPHDMLIDFRKIPLFGLMKLKRVGLISQWGIFRKPGK